MHLKINRAIAATAGEPVRPDGAYRPVSFWQETISIAPGAPLGEDTSCDVVIIGGGYTALSIAHELKRLAPSVDVVILERAVVGHGASGRNGGFVMPLLGWDLTDAVAKLGREAAADAYRMMYQAVAHTKQLIADHQIDCDLETTGYLLLATCSKREVRLREEAELGRQLGFDHQWLDRAAVRQHVLSDSFTTGVFDPHPAIVNPARLARGRLRVVQSLGVRVYEQTAVTELVEGERSMVRTPSGTVGARAAVLAVNGYGAALGFMPSRIIPVHTFIVMTEPLSDAQWEAIGWNPRRTSLETARNFIHYFRPTRDGRIMFGGEDVKLYWGGRYRDHDPPTFARLERRFREYFPALAALRFTHRWGGVLGVTLDMFPTFGVGGSAGNIFHAAGYSGHGVALSNYAGTIMAPQILARLDGHRCKEARCVPFFYGRRPWWLPPEPLRYVGLQLYRAALRAHDRWQRA